MTQEKCCKKAVKKIKEVERCEFDDSDIDDSDIDDSDIETDEMHQYNNTNLWISSCTLMQWFRDF